MTHPKEMTNRAKQILALLPALQQWATARAQRAGEPHQLSLRQFAALHAIREGATSPGELARRWQVTPAVLTGIIDRLERRGLVRREPDPEDRRRLRLVLTEAGMAASQEIERSLVWDLEERLATARLEDLAALDRTLPLLHSTLTAPHDQVKPAGIESNAVPEPGVESRHIEGQVTTLENAPMATSAQPEATPTGSKPQQMGAKRDDQEITELNLRDPRFMETAYDQYDNLRQQGPVVRVKFGGGEQETADQQENRQLMRQATYFVTDYDAVVATLLDDRFSVDPRSLMTPEQLDQAPEIPEEFRPLARSLLGIDPPDHTRIRKLVQPSFTGRGMAALRPSIQQTVDDLLDAAERDAASRGESAPNRRMELVEALAYPFPVTVISDLLGVPQEDREQLRGWTENLLRVDSQRGQPELETEIRAGLREFIAYLKDLFVRKRQQPGEDMISRMVLAEDDGETLTEEETLATVFLMYLAGHVTTVNLVGNGVVALLTHPEELAKVRADPSLIKNLVEETLRYWGPVDFIGRRFANEPLEVAGTPVNRGEEVTVSLAAANRDPARFVNPEVFDVSRDNANRHVAFGKGIHVCLGAPLARIESQVAFETLLRRYPELRLAVPAEDVEWSRSFLRGFREVPLLF